MAKKPKNLHPKIENLDGKSKDTRSSGSYYFGRENYRWMLIGLALILSGFLLMLGPDANTVDGVYSPDYWNDGIFSFRRIRIAPLLVILGFGVEVYAILKKNR
ncbi:DUF3098 domain-containing protein [Bergeyella sp. RCAD1439]|uniref:DUF3098 domain-containing protein n=1 Tax=Bergeyella anatis TaxID=3113737 RepID=UPI002E19BE96|nr:DUF3098 domain-containing protein [Bergeyella sp. RCAD1439]